MGKSGGRGPQLRVVSFPAPFGGLDAQSPISRMPPENALVLTNWIPAPAGVETRPGYAAHATGLPGAVETIFDHTGITGTTQLFAASGAGIYDITTAGAVGSAAVGSLTNAKWAQTMFATSAGNFLVIANGADSVRNYNGTSWSTPSITGATSSTFATVTAHQNRLWFCIKDTLKVAYLDVISIAGAATILDLGSLFKRGGYLVNMFSWTRDGGTGTDDLAVFVTSRGEVAIYNGTDPSSGTTWALEGVFQIPEPIGRNCGLKVGSDVALLTVNGVLPLNQILPLASGGTSKVAATGWIAPLFTQSAKLYSGNYGWQIVEHAADQLLIVNVPEVVNSRAIQYVMHTENGRWCKFTSMAANCWRVVGQAAYWGGNTKVFRYGQAYTDDGAAIVAPMMTSFQDFQSGAKKRFTQGRALIYAPRGADIPIQVRFDYDTSPSALAPPATVPGGVSWGAAWGSAWGPEITSQLRWRGLRGMGHTAALELVVSTKSKIRVNDFDVMFETGNFL